MGAAILDAGVGELVKLATSLVPGSRGKARGWRGGEPYVQSTQLGIRVLVVDALLQRAHGFLGLHRLGSDDVGDLEVEGDVFTVDGRKSVRALSQGLGGCGASIQAAASGLVYLLIQGIIGPGRPPPHHLGGWMGNWERGWC